MPGPRTRVDASLGAPCVAALLAGVLAWGGCGPIEYIANVPLDAAGAVSAAKQVKAEKYAPYEITAAQEYLHQARYLAGYARFHSSVTFARKSSKLAKEARTISVDKAAQPDEARANDPTGTMAPGGAGAMPVDGSKAGAATPAATPDSSTK